MSFLNTNGGAKKWVVHQNNPQSTPEIQRMASELGIHPIVATLLYGRGYTTTEKARGFLHMESEMLWDPFALKDMDKAVDRIESAISNNEHILIYGDYDVDGVTSVSTAYLYLQSRGATVSYHIPNRSGEGHGVSTFAIDKFAQDGVKLIITVDTGITAGKEVDYAKTIGVDFVITDHHECHADLPEAVAVVNPHRLDCTYPFKELAGVGVVFKLICALECRYTGNSMGECVRTICQKYGDLVAIGTIADVMPIIDENRLIVAYGLARMASAPRTGLMSLMEAAAYRGERRIEPPISSHHKNGKITSGYIGYTIAPRINAAGRIKSACFAVELFLTDKVEYADRLAELLCEANRERQAEENRITMQVFERIDYDYDFEKYPFIVLESNEWHHGVIGIVASRITEKYCLPCILISFDGCESDVGAQTDMGKGSGRSIKGVNLVEALCTCSELLPKFGGHELAAGLSIRRSDVPALREALAAYAKERFAQNPYENIIEAELEISPSDVSLALAEELQKLEPYGAGNPSPVFLMKDLFIKEVVSVTGGKHSKLIIGSGHTTLTAMYFSCSPSLLGLYAGDRADMLFSIDVNEYNGRKSAQLIIKDIRKAEAQIADEEKWRLRFKEIWNGAHFTAEEDIIPTRKDFADVYCFMRQTARLNIDEVEHHTILIGTRKDYGSHINFIKLKYIIRILQEMNVLGIDEYKEEFYRFKLHYNDEKVDLEKSNILRRLRSQQL